MIQKKMVGVLFAFYTLLFATLLFSLPALALPLVFTTPHLAPGDQLLLDAPTGQYRYLKPVAGENITFAASTPGTYTLLLRHANGTSENLSSYLVTQRNLTTSSTVSSSPASSSPDSSSTVSFSPASSSTSSSSTASSGSSSNTTSRRDLSLVNNSSTIFKNPSFPLNSSSLSNSSKPSALSLLSPRTVWARITSLPRLQPGTIAPVVPQAERRYPGRDFTPSSTPLPSAQGNSQGVSSQGLGSQGFATKRSQRKAEPRRLSSTINVSPSLAKRLETIRRATQVRLAVSGLNRLLQPLQGLTLADLREAGVSAALFDRYGKSVEIPLRWVNGTFTPESSRALKPGLYRLLLNDTTTGTVEEVWFPYGLISINTEHPLYHPGETARLLIVVLDKNGFPLAGARINLTVMTPSGMMTAFSTNDAITPTGKRGVYQLWYHLPSQTGEYRIEASTLLDGKTVMSRTSFFVQQRFPYDIVRDVPVTLDPNEGPFRNRFTIDPLDGAPAVFSLVERVPASFLITNSSADEVRLENETLLLVWRNVTAEDNLFYDAQSPLLSPYLYELGQALIVSGNETFLEARPWLLAIDPAALTCTSSPCDTGTLIDSRDSITGASEPNQPNTIDTCTDGTSGSYHSDESIDRMVITDLNHSTFTARDTVQVNITVWCWGAADNLNWVYTNNSVAPAWRVLSSMNCPSGGSLQTFSYTFVLDDTPGNHTIRGVFQYNGANTATCGTGSYDDNDDVTLAVRDRDRAAPVHHSLRVNQTTAPINGSVKVIADVTDNVAVAGVNATVKRPDGSSQNLTLLLSNISTSLSSGDLESGTVTYDAVTTPPGYATVQQGLVTFSSAQASQTITITPVNLSHAFLIVSSTADARSNADLFTYTGTFVNSTAITLARSATGTSGSAAYYVVEASNINVTNGTTSFAATDTIRDVTIPDQGSNYASKTFVVLSVQSQSSSRNYVNEAYVTGVLTSPTNLRLERDDSGNAPLSVSWFVVRFLDGTTVQTGETSVTTTGTATLSPVVTNRTWLYFTTRMSANGLAYTSIHGNLENSTQASFSRTSSSGTAYARWFAIEFPDSQGAWAEHGLQAGSGTGEATANIAISAVNTSRSFGYVTQDSTGTGSAYPRPWWTEQLTSATNIQVARGYTGQTSNHDWQAVSWPVDPGTPDIEANKSFTTYNNVTNDSFTALEKITVTTTISSYSNAGSQQRTNNDANLEVQLYNGSVWRSIGLFNVTGTGTYSLTTTEPSLLRAWLTPSARDVRVRAVNMDYADASHADTLSYTALAVTLYGNQTRYAADWNTTSVAGRYNVTDLWSIDTSGNTNHTTYSTVTFLILNYGIPSITINDVEGDTTETYSFTNQTPAINATIDTNATCYLSTVDESYSEMVANGRVNCGVYTLNVPKSCTYTTTLPVGSGTLHMACNNSFSNVTNNVTNNKDFTIDVLCDTHADCPANEYCDYTFHCVPDVVDGYECKETTYNGQPSDAVCGGGSDPGTCVNDSSYSFTGWYCAHDADDCVFNDSGHTYDLHYALCNALAGPNDYRSCASGQLWSAIIDCGDLNEGADPNGTTHPGANCSYYATPQTCQSGDLDLGSYGCAGSATDCGPYIYLGSGLCGNTLADCDVGCGARCDANNDTSPAIVSGVCYYDKSCSDGCAWSVNQEDAPSFCINDADGGPCAFTNRTDPSQADTCYYNVTCQDGTGASLLNSSPLRQAYCDYCTATGTATGSYAPPPNASCTSNCSNNGTIYYDSGGTPLDRSDDCDGSGGTTILSDTLTYGDIWNGSGPATCDDAECELDAGPYLNGSCVGGPTGTCTFSDPEPPIITIVHPDPPNGTWFNTSPALFEYQVEDLGSGVANCSLYINDVLDQTTTTPAEGVTLNFTYSPSLGSFTWGIACVDDSSQANRAWTGSYNSGYDTTVPVIGATAVNDTNLSVNQKVCLNVTVTDTYSGLKTVEAKISLPGGNGVATILLTDDASSCDAGVGNNVYSAEYTVVFSGTYSWDAVTAVDVAGNTNTSPTTLSWNVSAGGVLLATMERPTSNLLINESGTNSQYTQNCSVQCTDEGIPCEDVTLYAEYENGSGYQPVTTTTRELVNTLDSYACGNLTTAPAPWWNRSWPYRRAINITDTAQDVTEYQIELRIDTASLISAGKLRGDCGDLRFTTRKGELIPYYVDEDPGLGCNRSDTLVWVQVPSLYQNYKNKIFMYYGNDSATSLSNISAVFSYTEQKPLYYAIGDFNTRSDVDIISYTDNNSVTLSGNGETTTLNEGQIYTGYDAADINAGDYWSAKGPLAFGCLANGCDSPIPISYAGTEFIIFIDRGGTGKEWFVYAPFGDGTVTWYNGSSGGSFPASPIKTLSVTQGTRYHVTDADGNDDNIFWINSTTPILLGFEQGTGDTIVIHPAETEMWGISEDVAYASSGTVRQLCESNAACSTTTRNGPYRESLGGSNDGSAPASHVNASKKIGYSHTADSDGYEAYYGQPEYEFSPVYYAPVDFQYIAGAVTGGTNCTWYNRSTPVTVTLSGSNPYPSPKKLYIADGTSNPADSYGGAGDKVVCNSPFFAAFEPNTDDEANLWSYKQARQLVWPEPVPTLEGEETLSALNMTGSTCSYTFTITANESGNHTFPIRCRASASNAATVFDGNVNVTVNDKPTPTIDAPLNNSWLAGLVTLNASSSFDSDGTLVEYRFEYDNNTAFSSPGVICSTNQPACTWNTSAQSQCANNSLSCALRVIETDNHGLANTSGTVIVGFDTNGPVTMLDQVPSFGNITTSIVVVNATVVDNEVGTISRVMFEYRENSTVTWKSACNDTDGSAPFECAWNLSLLPDGRTYELRAFANDTLGNLGGASIHTNITLDRKGPRIQLVAPPNATYTLGNETLFYNVTDATSAVANCTLLLDGIGVNTTSNPAEGVTLNFSVTDLSEGSHTWAVTCADALGNQNTSTSRTLIVDLTGPVTVLDQPPTGGNAYGLFTVNASVTDNGVGTISVVTFEYRENSTVTWLPLCNDSDGLPPYNCTWNTTGVTDGGAYQVRAFANDTLGNLGGASTHTSITVDNNPPVITDLSPRDGFIDTDGNVQFTYRVNDVGSGVANCSLYINGTLNQTALNPSEGVEHSFFLYGLNDTTFNWSIACWDTFSPQPHRAVTPNRTLIVNIIYFLNASVSANQTVYAKGDQAGESANVTTNTTDIVNESISANVTTDIIKTMGESHDIWWNTSWQYRIRKTITEDLGVNRENYWVSLPFTLDPACDGLAAVDSLRLVQDVTPITTFYEWNRTMCDATHIKSLWVTFRLNLSANQSTDLYLYFNSSTTLSPLGIVRGPMRIVWVSTGGSGNAPDTTTVKQDLNSALGNLGLSSSGFYDEISTSASASDLAWSDVADYAIVLYDSAAKYSTSWDATEASVLHRFVNASGSLFLTGQDLGYDANGNGWIYNAAWRNLTSTSGGWVDNTNPTTFTVAASHPVTQYLGSVGTTVSVAGDYEDGYTTMAGGVQLLNWTGSGNPIAATARDCLAESGCFLGKSVYYAGIFYISTSQGIQDSAAREHFFRGVLEWFLTGNNLSASDGALEKWVARNNGTTSSSDGLWSWLFSVFSFSTGRYEAVSQASRFKYNNASAWTAFNVSLDAVPPLVSLVSPPNGSEENSSVTFSYRVDDALSSIQNCTLFIDGTVSDSDTTVQEGLPQFFYPRIPSGGPHNWTVCCVDAYNNTGCAENRTVIIIPPDVTSNTGNISVTPGPYREGMNVTITVTVWNIGGSDTGQNVTVQLWDGVPGAGVQIGANSSVNLTDRFGTHDHAILSWNWTIPRPGPSVLHVIMDPPLATNGSLFELNESNNDVNFTIATPAYTIFYGNVTTTLLLDTAENKTFVNFSGQRNNTGLLFFTDADASVSFTSLQALGRNVANNSALHDFTDADVLLNMTTFPDSVNDVWARGNNTPVMYDALTVGGKVITDVPVINSSSTGAFKTGILWDASHDSTGEYDTGDREPILFVTKLNTSAPGDYGVYDFQSKVPALLRDYAGSGGTTIYLYYELQ